MARLAEPPKRAMSSSTDVRTRKRTGEEAATQPIHNDQTRADMDTKIDRPMPLRSILGTQPLIAPEYSCLDLVRREKWADSIAMIRSTVLAAPKNEMRFKAQHAILHLALASQQLCDDMAMFHYVFRILVTRAADQSHEEVAEGEVARLKEVMENVEDKEVRDRIITGSQAMREALDSFDGPGVGSLLVRGAAEMDRTTESREPPAKKGKISSKSKGNDEHGIPNQVAQFCVAFKTVVDRWDVDVIWHCNLMSYHPHFYSDLRWHALKLAFLEYRVMQNNVIMQDIFKLARKICKDVEIKKVQPQPMPLQYLHLDTVKKLCWKAQDLATKTPARLFQWGSLLIHSDVSEEITRAHDLVRNASGVIVMDLTYEEAKNLTRISCRPDYDEKDHIYSLKYGQPPFKHVEDPRITWALQYEQWKFTQAGSATDQVYSSTPEMSSPPWGPIKANAIALERQGQEQAAKEASTRQNGQEEPPRRQKKGAAAKNGEVPTKDGGDDGPQEGNNDTAMHDASNPGARQRRSARTTKTIHPYTGSSASSGHNRQPKANTSKRRKPKSAAKVYDDVEEGEGEEAEEIQDEEEEEEEDIAAKLHSLASSHVDTGMGALPRVSVQVRPPVRIFHDIITYEDVAELDKLKQLIQTSGIKCKIGEDTSTGIIPETSTWTQSHVDRLGAEIDGLMEQVGECLGKDDSDCMRNYNYEMVKSHTVRPWRNDFSNLARLMDQQDDCSNVQFIWLYMDEYNDLVATGYDPIKCVQVARGLGPHTPDMLATELEGLNITKVTMYDCTESDHEIATRSTGLGTMTMEMRAPMNHVQDLSDPTYFPIVFTAHVEPTGLEDLLKLPLSWTDGKSSAILGEMMTWATDELDRLRTMDNLGLDHRISFGQRGAVIIESFSINKSTIIAVEHGRVLLQQSSLKNVEDALGFFRDEYTDDDQQSFETPSASFVLNEGSVQLLLPGAFYRIMFINDSVLRIEKRSLDRLLRPMLEYEYVRNRGEDKDEDITRWIKKVEELANEFEL